MYRFVLLFTFVLVASCVFCSSQFGLLQGSARQEEPKPAPRLQAVPQPYHQVSFCNGSA